MGFRFHKSFRVLPGVRLNVAKRSLSVSVGAAPATLNKGRKRKARITLSAPGTGLSYITSPGKIARGIGKLFGGTGKTKAKPKTKTTPQESSTPADRSAASRKANLKRKLLKGQ